MSQCGYITHIDQGITPRQAEGKEHGILNFSRLHLLRLHIWPYGLPIGRGCSMNAFQLQVYNRLMVKRAIPVTVNVIWLVALDYLVSVGKATKSDGYYRIAN